MKPGRAQVIAFEPEFMVPQDGHEKHDCEREAAKRWVRESAACYSSLGITLLGDGLYATQPMIEIVVGEELDYIFVVKSTNHNYLYEELESFQKLGRIQELTHTKGTGRKRRHFLYRYVNGAPLTGGEKSVEVNWVELTMTYDSGSVPLEDRKRRHQHVEDQGVSLRAQLRTRFAVFVANPSVAQHPGIPVLHGAGATGQTLCAAPYHAFSPRHFLSAHRHADTILLLRQLAAPAIPLRIALSASPPPISQEHYPSCRSALVFFFKKRERGINSALFL